MDTLKFHDSVLEYNPNDYMPKIEIMIIEVMIQVVTHARKIGHVLSRFE